MTAANCYHPATHGRGTAFWLGQPASKQGKE